MGSLDSPFNPVSLALGAEATFVARTIDSDRKHLTSVLRAAAEHKGTALVEIYQNCNIFNDDAFEPLKDPATRDDFTIRLEHGQPITLGRRRRSTASSATPTRARRWSRSRDVDADDLVVHDAHQPRTRRTPSPCRGWPTPRWPARRSASSATSSARSTTT